MNILKVYDNLAIMSCEMREFVFANPGSKLLHKDNVVELYNGTRVYFRIIGEMRDAHALAGIMFQCLDISSSAYIEREALEYLQSRIRG